MKIVDLVNKLEEIEKESKGKAKELCGILIDDLIAQLPSCQKIRLAI